MRRFIIVLIVNVCFGTSFAQKSKDKQIPEQKQASIFPIEILNVLEQADSVIWYLLDPMVEDSVYSTYALMGEILCEQVDTCDERIGSLKAILSYPKSFEKTCLSKDCIFLPDIACVVYANKQLMVFSYSFYCDLCRFEYNSIKKEIDGELLRESILQIVIEIFPKDRYIQRLAGKTR